MYRKLTALAVAVVLFVSAFAFTSAPAGAQNGGNPRVAFLGGLLNVLIEDLNIEDNVVQVGLVNVNRSLNNLRVLNNLLRDADIIDDITIQDIRLINGDVNLNLLNGALNNLQVTALNNFLNQNDINANVVRVAILSGGDLVIFR